MRLIKCVSNPVGQLVFITIWQIKSKYRYKQIMKKDLRATIQQFLWILLLAVHPNKQLLVVGGCYLIISFFDLLGLGVLFVFLKQYFFSDYNLFIFDFQLQPMAVLLVIPLIWVFKFCFVLLANFFIVTYSHSLTAKLRLKVVDELFRLPFPSSRSPEKNVWLDTLNRQLGDMATAIIEPTLRGLLDLLLIILICAYMTYLAPTIFVGLGFFVTLGLVAFDQLIRRPLKEFGYSYNLSSEALTLDLSKLIEGLPEFWSLRARRIFLKRVSYNSASIVKSYTRFSLLSMSPRLFLESLMVIGLSGLILIFETYSFERELLITSLAIVGVGCLRLIPLLNSVNLGLNQLRGAHRTLTNISDLVPVEEMQPVRHTELKIVRLKAVKLHKRFDATPVFDDIDLDLCRGQAIAVIGQSGCGKTTLCETLAGLLPADSGRVVILEEDGNEIEIEKAKQRIGVVAQRPIMFEGTIRENLLLGHEEENMDPSFSLDEAMYFSGFGKVLESCPDGLGTLIGDTARKLSGGQQQKLAICRSLLLSQGMIVFDEPTSAFDSSSEKYFFSMIEHIKQRAVVIVATHSKAYLENFDTVIELSTGKVEIKDVGAAV